MIQVADEWWGTAAEIATHLGHGVTDAVVRSWARSDSLCSLRVHDENGRPQVWYPLIEASRIDRAKRHSRRGRPRGTTRRRNDSGPS
jgi:hypothetical protein